MKFKLNEDVQSVIQSYPKEARAGLEILRGIIVESAEETEGVDYLDETLKWGEPSYLTKNGSTVRIDWKESDPEYIAMYFHCQTTLVDTFRELYRDLFNFDGNRAILFKIGEKVPAEELKHCVSLSLTYHKRKHLWMLGV